MTIAQSHPQYHTAEWGGQTGKPPVTVGCDENFNTSVLREPKSDMVRLPFRKFSFNPVQTAHWRG